MGIPAVPAAAKAKPGPALDLAPIPGMLAMHAQQPDVEGLVQHVDNAEQGGDDDHGPNAVVPQLPPPVPAKAKGACSGAS